MISIIFRIVLFPITIPAFIFFGRNIPRWIPFVGGSGSTESFPTLVMTDYRLAERGSTDNVLLEVHGRYRGWRNFFLKRIGIAAKPYLRVTNRELLVEVTTLAGTNIVVVPLENITTAASQAEKPVSRLWLGGIFLLGAVLAAAAAGPLAIIPAVIGIFFIISYFRGGRLILMFSTSGVGNQYGLAFKRGKLEYGQLVETMQRINRNVVAAHRANMAPLQVSAVDRSQ